jgi:hypothetical protein
MPTAGSEILTNSTDPQVLPQAYANQKLKSRDLGKVGIWLLCIPERILRHRKPRGTESRKLWEAATPKLRRRCTERKSSYSQTYKGLNFYNQPASWD